MQYEDCIECLMCGGLGWLIVGHFDGDVLRHYINLCPVCAVITRVYHEPVVLCMN